MSKPKRPNDHHQPADSKRQAGRRKELEPVAHRRVREDHATEKAEDYVEAIAEIIQAQGICRNADLARRFGVSHVTTLRIVERLVTAQLVRTRPYGPLELTAKGLKLARHCAERHQLVLDFLLAIDVPPAIAAVDAEGIEHHVSPETLNRFAEFIRRKG
jgi:DtxR family manganese transport transcriptional regulator